MFNPNRDEVEDLKTRYREGKVGDVEVKAKLTAALNTFLDPIRDRRRQFEEDKGYVEEVLYEGTLRAVEIADETLKEVKKAM